MYRQDVVGLDMPHPKINQDGSKNKIYIYTAGASYYRASIFLCIAYHFQKVMSVQQYIQQDITFYEIPIFRNDNIYRKSSTSHMIHDFNMTFKALYK